MRDQEADWISRLLPTQNLLHPDKSTPLDLFRLVGDVMSSRMSPEDAATQTASLVSRDPNTWFDFVGIDVALAERIEDEDALAALVDYLAALASLPDAVNESQEAVIVEHIGYEGASVRIEPGELLVIGDSGKRLWKDLPGWSMNITENFQGASPCSSRSHSCV